MILSLDASTTHIGWAVFENDDLIAYGKIEPTVPKLDWKDRVDNMIPQVIDLIKKFNPTQIYQEQVPMGGKGGALILSQLFYLQGALHTIQKYLYKIPVTYITVGTWRKNIGIGDGDKNRDVKKIRSLQKANELFNLNLSIAFTKNGKFNPSKSDDDISDAILVYASTREKYQSKKVAFGKTAKVGD